MSLFSRLNSFVENRLRVRRYSVKIVLLFSLIILLSMVLSFSVDVFYSLRELKEDLTRAAQRAASFRTTAIENEIEALRRADLSLADLIHRSGPGAVKAFLGKLVTCAVGEGFSVGEVDARVLTEAKKTAGDREFFLYLEPGTWRGVAVVRHRGKTYAFCHDLSSFERILSREVGAIAKYGAEFYFGVKPQIEEGDILVSYRSGLSNASMFVVISYTNLMRALIKERVILYLRLYLGFLLFLSISYIFWAKLINHPIRKLREIVRELERGNSKVDFSDLIGAKDEFGSIARILRNYSKDMEERLEKMELILDTAFNPVSSPEEIYPFVKFTLGRLDEILETKGSLFLVKDLQGGKYSFLIPSPGLPEEGMEDLVRIFEEKEAKLNPLTEDLVCIREFRGRECLGIVLFNLGRDSRGAVLIRLREELSKENESYVKVICQHLIGTIRLSHLASTDPLTGVPNRRMLEIDLRKHGKLAKRYNKKLSLIMIDIDNFKGVNDTYGHQAGDEVLRRIAYLILRNIRETDALYRYGGEEFAVLCPETDKEGAFELAERIRESVRRERFGVGRNKSLYITVSLGVASFPEDTRDPSELLAIADLSLYKAKTEGRNRTSTLLTSRDRDLYLERFRRERDLADLILSGSVTHHLQPIYNLRNNTVYGYELLSRVVKNGEVLPLGRFLDSLEDTSVMEEIDLRTVERLREFLKREDLFTYSFFINISPRSLERGTVLSELSKFPKHMRSRVFIEITEREGFLNLESALNYFEILKELGFRIVMDDFGRGFSSISVMRYFIKFIDLIKVDGMFVRNVHRDPYNRAILQSIKTMADRFSIDIVAEHIENERDLETIKRMGIKFGQGYHLGNAGAGFTA
jgi:diguanylate cyclase (GGDEF)-like protein